MPENERLPHYPAQAGRALHRLNQPAPLRTRPRPHRAGDALHGTALHCTVVQVEEVWRRAVVSRQPQSLVLTGRSGSGKTCNFKQALAHLVETTQPSAGECPLSGERLAAVDCLLESFCSTRTSLNTHARCCVV